MATDYTAYWLATCLRGVIALVTGVTIAFGSSLGGSILLLPIAALATAISLLALASYVVVDSAMVLATSFMLPHHHLGRVALRIQGVIGMTIGITCFVVFQYKGSMEGWFLYLAAIQACCVAVADYLSARDTAEFHNSKWCYAASVVAALSGVALMTFHHAEGHLLFWLLYSYLWCFGLLLLVLSCHMLFEELRPSKSRVGP